MITGYRRFKIEGHPEPLLRGAHNYWDGRELQAQCLGLDDWSDSTLRCERHLLAGDCMCGIYVLKGPDMIQDYQTWPAIAAVTAWGAYTEFELGYRMQHVRLEYIWIEPQWIERIRLWEDVDVMIQLMKLRYDVPVEIRQSAVCCGQDHEMAFWPSKAGPISICKMETSHIVNCMKYLNGSTSRRYSSGAKWLMVFQKELERRKPLRIDGKTKVVF